MRLLEKNKEIGYEQDGFHWKNLKIENLLHDQSTDIHKEWIEMNRTTIWCWRSRYNVWLCV